MSINTNEPIGIFDIGSNSVRFVVYAPPFDHQKDLFNEKVQCSLGKDLVRTKRLYPEGKSRALKAMKGFQSIAEAMDVRQFYAVGTAALRDAEDGEAFVKEVYDLTGFNVQIISGEEEAMLAAKSVLSKFPEADGIIGDLGGGSLELARVKNYQVTSPISYHLGVLRIMAQDDARAYVQAQLENVPEVLQHTKSLYVIGGTWRALADLHMQSTAHESHKLSGYTVPHEEMRYFAKKISLMAPEDIMEKFVVAPKRATMLPSASILMVELTKHLHFDNIVISTTGLRNGLLRDVLDRQLAA